MLPSDNYSNLPLFLQWNKIYNVEDVSTEPGEKQESVEGKTMIWTSLYKCISWLTEPTVSEVLDTISKILLFLNLFKIKIIRYYFKNRLLINLHSPIILNILNFSSKEF